MGAAFGLIGQRVQMLPATRARSVRAEMWQEATADARVPSSRRQVVEVDADGGGGARIARGWTAR